MAASLRQDLQDSPSQHDAWPEGGHRAAPMLDYSIHFFAVSRLAGRFREQALNPFSVVQLPESAVSTARRRHGVVPATAIHISSANFSQFRPVGECPYQPFRKTVNQPSKSHTMRAVRQSAWLSRGYQ